MSWMNWENAGKVANVVGKSSLGFTTKLAVVAVSSAIVYMNETPSETQKRETAVQEVRQAINDAPKNALKYLGWCSEEDKREELAAVRARCNNMPIIRFSGSIEQVDKFVYVVARDIDYPLFNTNMIYRFWGREAGISLAALSHWSVVVIDPRSVTSLMYELMSPVPLRNKLMVHKVDAQIARKWTLWDFAGKTNMSDEDIRDIGRSIIRQNPTYHLVFSQCQNFVETFIRETCHVTVGLQLPTLARELLQAQRQMFFRLWALREAGDKVMEIAREMNCQPKRVRDDLSTLTRLLEGVVVGEEMSTALTI